MYNSNNIAEIIKDTAKAKGVSVNQLLKDVNLGKNTMSNFRSSMPKADNLAKIADYLDCSVDYLLGRTKSITVFPVKSKNPTTIHKKINLGELFNQNIPLKKYMSRLWEAHKEIFSVNTLLENLIVYKPFMDDEWFIVFKYNVLILCSTAQLLSVKNNKFSEQLKELLDKPEVRMCYDNFKEFYDKNKKFIEKTRNIVAHFDHTKDSQTYLSFISSQTDYDVYLKNKVLTDDNIYISVIVELYNELYKKQASDKETIIKVVGLFSELTCVEHKLLLEILWDFYIKNKVFLDDELQKHNDSITTKSNHIGVDIGVINDNHGIIGHTHAPVTIINSAKDERTEQEKALLDIFKKLDVVKQAQLLAYAAELEER